MHILLYRIALQFFTDYLSHHLLYIEESHGGVIVNLRNGVIHIVNDISLSILWILQGLSYRFGNRFPRNDRERRIPLWDASSSIGKRKTLFV